MNVLLALLPLIPSILSSLGGVVGQAGASAPVTAQTSAMQSLLQADAAFIKQAQQFLNDAQSLGLVSFGSALSVDGIAGAKTTAALQAVIAKYMPAA